MNSTRTGSPEATRALGASIADLLRAGDLLLLVGGLGAGKTTFVQGLARGLGYDGEVTSPTFTLSHTYAGHLDLVHVDLWRLERTSEILDLGLDEEIEDGAVVVAEWGEGVAGMLGDDALVVSFEPVGGDDFRQVTFEARGHWRDRVGALAVAVAEVAV